MKRLNSPGSVLALSLLLLAVTACSSNPVTSTPPLSKPIVSCGEHEPFEHLPAYPDAPSDDLLQTDPAALRAYSSEQSLWGIQAAGVFERDAIRRNATSDCLDVLRARGIIL